MTEVNLPSWEVINALLSHQNFCVNVIFIITALILTATVIWHVFLAKKEIRKDVEECFKKYDKINKDLFSKESERIKDSIKKDITFLRAESNRIFALHCAEIKMWGHAVDYAVFGLEKYMELDHSKGIRSSVNVIRIWIKKPDWNRDLKEDKLKEIKLIVTKIPDILNNEKEEILEKLKKAIKSKSKPKE